MRDHDRNRRSAITKQLELATWRMHLRESNPPQFVTIDLYSLEGSKNRKEYARLFLFLAERNEATYAVSTKFGTERRLLAVRLSESEFAQWLNRLPADFDSQSIAVNTSTDDIDLFCTRFSESFEGG